MPRLWYLLHLPLASLVLAPILRGLLPRPWFATGGDAMPLLPPVSPFSPSAPGGGAPLRPGTDAAGRAQQDGGAFEKNRNAGVKIVDDAMKRLNTQLPFDRSNPQAIAEAGKFLAGMAQSSQPMVKTTAAVRAARRREADGRLPPVGQDRMQKPLDSGEKSGRSAPSGTAQDDVGKKLLKGIEDYGTQLQAKQVELQTAEGDANANPGPEEILQECNQIGDQVKILMEALKFWYKTTSESTTAIARNV